MQIALAGAMMNEQRDSDDSLFILFEFVPPPSLSTRVFYFLFLKAALIGQVDGAFCLLRIQLVDAPQLIYFKTHFSVRQK